MVSSYGEADHSMPTTRNNSHRRGQISGEISRASVKITQKIDPKPEKSKIKSIKNPKKNLVQYSSSDYLFETYRRIFTFNIE